MEGIRFDFNDYEGTHQETLMLTQAGEAVEGVHKSPLYKLQGLDPRGEMVEVEFDINTQKDQTSQGDGRPDRVKFRRSLRVVAVRLVPEESGNGAKAPARSTTS